MASNLPAMFRELKACPASFPSPQAGALAADPGNARLAGRLSELWRSFRCGAVWLRGLGHWSAGAGQA